MKKTKGIIIAISVCLSVALLLSSLVFFAIKTSVKNSDIVATVNGLEVIDISSAKSEADVSNLVIEAKLLDGEKINAVEVTGNTLYVGADNKLVVYSISEGIPQLTNSFDFEGGFKDFEINEEENLLYALSNSASGGAVIISLDTLFLIAQHYNFDIRNFFDGYEELMVKKDN